MITFTLGDVLGDHPPEPDSPHCIYVVRDGDLVLYVGLSVTDVIDRIRNHAGRGSFNRIAPKSELGQLMAANDPESNAWQVELLNESDCMPYLQRFIPMPVVNFDWQLAEIAVIRELQPCLNRTHNSNAAARQVSILIRLPVIVH